MGAGFHNKTPTGELNLSRVAALIVDSDQFAVGILTNILRGFGLTEHSIADSAEAAKRQLSTKKFDVIFSEAVLPDMLGAEFVKWLRRSVKDDFCFLPVVVLTGHTQIGNVLAARDCGANIVVKKPVSSTVLYEHMVWAANSDRNFIETASYVGPDRRFKSIGPPDGVGRRSTDLSAEIGEASDDNLSQSEIDAFMKPVKVKVE